MTIHALMFIVGELGTDRRTATGLLSPEARYASRWRHGAPRPDRLPVSPKLWRAIEAELKLGLSPGPLPRESALSMLMTDGSAFLTVQWLWRKPIAIGEPTDAAVALDGTLRVVGGGGG